MAVAVALEVNVSFTGALDMIRDCSQIMSAKNVGI